MKILSVLVVALAVFFYYIYDAMGKLNSVSRKVWTGVAFVIVFASVVWGFSVLGSPRTQQLLKYDVQKVGDLQNINSQVENYYRVNGVLPKDLKEMSENEYYVLQVDPQSQKSYEYNKTSATTYELCAEFNKASDDVNNVNGNITFPVYYDRYGTSKTWAHPAGQFCFKQTINPNMYTKPAPNY
jgi:hypothetical protein